MRSTALVLAAVLVSCAKASPSGSMPVPVGDSPQRGPSDAWVTIVEFSDFQCPFCGLAEPTVERVLADYPQDVRLVYKHYPLSFHAYARPAAIAAECAREQGQFWEMHDQLFAHQDKLTDADLASYASAVGLDVAAWQSCLASPEPAARVDADVSLGNSMGLRATPTFAVNGEPVVGAVDLATFEQIVESARAQAEASGIPRSQYYRRAVLGD